MKKYTVELTEEQLKQLGIEVEPEFKYPLFKRWRTANLILKFTDLNAGEVVWKGESTYDVIKLISDAFVPHTDYNWEDVAYDEERDLWDGQPVECWDDDSTHTRHIKFYDAVNNCCYFFNGKRYGRSHDNYKALSPDRYDEWIIEAHKTMVK